jgi:autotransporter-associated beta strand protein
MLAKTNGAHAIQGPLEVLGFSTNTGTVRLEGNEQIFEFASSASVTLEGGLLDLNGFTETVPLLSLDGAAVTTGSGLLILNDQVVQGTSTSLANGTSTISGNVSLGITPVFEDRRFVVNNNTAGDDLVITATVQGPSNLRLAKQGPGTLLLSGLNEYLGVTEVEAGVLAIASDTALGPNHSATTHVSSGATLEIRGGSSAIHGDEEIRLEGLGLSNLGALRNTSGDNSWAGRIVYGQDTTVVRVESGSQLTHSGDTASSAAATEVRKTGFGRLVFSGNSNYLTDTVVSQGTLALVGAAPAGSRELRVLSGATAELANRTAPLNQQTNIQLNGNGVGGAGALRLTDGNATVSSPISLNTDSRIGVNDGSVLTISGVISGAATPDLIKVGPGNLILTAANDYDGPTQIQEGTLTIRNGSALGPNGNPTTVHSGATLAIDGKLNVAEETLNLGGHGVNGQGALVMLSPKILFQTDTATWSRNVNLDGPTTITVNANSTLNLTGIITGDAASSLNKGGVGVLSFGGGSSNQHLGVTQVSDGRLELAKTGGAQAMQGNVIVGDGVGSPASAKLVVVTSNRIPNTSDVTVNADGLFRLGSVAETIDVLILAGGVADSGPGTFNINRLDSTPAAVSGVVNGKLALPSVGATFLIANGSAAPDVTINAVVTGGGIVKSGPGDLLLAGDNVLGNSLVLQGEMIVNGAQSTSNVGVDASPGFGGNAVLSGAGAVGSINLRNGALSPGVDKGQTAILTSVGGLSVSNSNAFDARRTFLVDFNGGLVPGADHDQLFVIGGVNLGGAKLTGLEVNAPSSFSANNGDEFVIINNDGATDAVSGEFIGLPPGARVDINGLAFFINYQGGDGNDVTLKRNTRPTFVNRTVTSPILEGDTATLTGTIVDPDPLDTFHLDVDWGDGIVKTFSFSGADGETVNITHTYEDENDDDQYVIRLTWRDDYEIGNSAELAVVVHNVDPTVNAGGDALLAPGGALNRNGSFADPGADTWTAIVDYGDGNGPQPLKLLPGGRFHLQHRYAQPGTYLVTVTVTDDDGGVGAAAFTVEAPARKGHDPLTTDIVFALFEEWDDLLR